MQVTTSAIINGEFADQYGKRGSQFSENGMPTYSIPFEISGAPEGTQSFAVVLEDKDAITASGFVWIHWLIADLERTSVAENDSIAATDYVHRARTVGRACWENSASRRLRPTAAWRRPTAATATS